MMRPTLVLSAQQLRLAKNNKARLERAFLCLEKFKGEFSPQLVKIVIILMP